MFNQPIFSKFYNQEFDANKPTIVFIHEALGSVAQWKDFPHKVAALTGFNAFAYDRLGHGQSNVQSKKRDLRYLHREAHEVLPSLLRQYNIENPILFGHSDGGTIALLYASMFKTKAIITEAAHVFVEDVTVEGIEQAQKRKDTLIDKLKRYHGDKTHSLWASWTDTWLNKSFKHWNIEPVLTVVRCPSLIIQGENDEYATKEQVQRIVSGIGEKARELLIPDCGHAPHKEREEIILSNIQMFLN